MIMNEAQMSLLQCRSITVHSGSSVTESESDNSKNCIEERHRANLIFNILTNLLQDQSIQLQRCCSWECQTYENCVDAPWMRPSEWCIDNIFHLICAQRVNALDAVWVPSSIVSISLHARSCIVILHKSFVVSCSHWCACNFLSFLVYLLPFRHIESVISCWLLVFNHNNDTYPEQVRNKTAPIICVESVAKAIPKYKCQ